MGSPMTSEFIVLDFETTGLRPDVDRTIEVAATRLVDHRPVETFSALMYPGTRLHPFITALTGISDEMLRGKPRPEEVMPHLRVFVGDRPIVAHNASFDRGFCGPSWLGWGLTWTTNFYAPCAWRAGWSRACEAIGWTPWCKPWSCARPTPCTFTARWRT